jgi:hypothetical protein
MKTCQHKGIRNLVAPIKIDHRGKIAYLEGFNKIRSVVSYRLSNLSDQSKFTMDRAHFLAQFQVRDSSFHPTDGKNGTSSL